MKEREPITEVSQLTDIIYGYAYEGPSPLIATSDSRLMARASSSGESAESRVKANVVDTVAVPATSDSESSSTLVEDSADSGEEEN